MPAPLRSESLSRVRVIRRRGIFELTRNQGRRVSNRWMALNSFPRELSDPAEVAFLTPKRLGPATVRNRLRRRMREIYRRHLVPPREKAYRIWIARPPAVDLDFEALKKCMADLGARSR
jgi:ribonuclease P protein component